MKKRLIILSIIILGTLINIGNTEAWFISQSPASITRGKMGIVEVEVLEEGEDIRVKNLGTSQALVRVRLIPQWTDKSLSTSNIDLEFNLDDWEIRDDGYLYYKQPLDESGITPSLLKSISLGELREEHRNQSLKIKVVAEGVQMALDKAWNP